jgi:uncharacterized protein YqeY
MATLLDQVTQRIGEAMKQKDQAALAPLRMLKSAIMNREVEKGRALDGRRVTAGGQRAGETTA